MFNPFIKGGVETLGMLMGGGEGKKKNIAPFLGKLLSNVSEGTSLGVDEYTGKTVWQTPELFSQLIQQVPALQDLNMMFRNDRDDQLFRIINKLTGADIVPVDYEEQLQRRMAESGAEMTKQRDALAKALGYEIKTPEYDYTELAIPPSSTKMFEKMQGYGLPLTEEGYEEAKRLLAEEKGYEGEYYSKMEWPTLEEVKKVRKGRISVLFKGPKGFIPGYQANPVQQFMSEDEFRRIIGQ
jgi:hypothetical protein